MTRTRATAKQAGTSFETAIATYLQQVLDDRIERRRLTGAKDRGDFSGIRFHHIEAALRRRWQQDVEWGVRGALIRPCFDRDEAAMVVRQSHGHLILVRRTVGPWEVQP